VVSRCAVWRSRAKAERSRYDIYYYIMAAPADEETDRWLWRVSERGSENDGLRFKNQRVLDETSHTLPSKDRWSTVVWGEQRLKIGFSSLREARQARCWTTMKRH